MSKDEEARSVHEVEDDGFDASSECSVEFYMFRTELKFRRKLSTDSGIAVAGDHEELEEREDRIKTSVILEDSSDDGEIDDRNSNKEESDEFLMEFVVG